MSIKGLALLRELFAERYGTLRTHVARRLGASGDLADDALHDAYVRLADKGGLEEVRHPQSYLVNTAVHVAIDRMRASARVLSETEIENFLEVEDETPGPAETASARQQWARMHDVLGALPPRQLDILVAVRVHGLTRNELAKRWGISERQVSRELLAAHTFCAQARQASED